MRLLRTDIYALQLLGYFATQDRARWVSGEELSSTLDIGKPYMRRVLATLASAGIIASKKGTGGGYALAREARDISLLEVLLATGGPIAPLPCTALADPQTCEEQLRCLAREGGWKRVRDALRTALSTVSVADLEVDIQQGNDYQLCLEHLLRPGG